MKVIRTLQKSPLGQRRGILSCLRWYTQIWSKVAREKIGALGPATGPKELTFFPIGFDQICIYHQKQLKIPRRWGAIPPRNISGKKDIDENTWNYEKSLRGSQGSQGLDIKDWPTFSSKSLVGLSNMWEQKKSVIYPKPKKKWEKNWKLRTISMGHPVHI